MFCLHVYLCIVYVSSNCRGHHWRGCQIPWKLKLQMVWVGMWMLEIKLGFSGKPLSLQPIICILLVYSHVLHPNCSPLLSFFFFFWWGGRIWTPASAFFLRDWNHRCVYTATPGLTCIFEWQSAELLAYTWLCVSSHCYNSTFGSLPTLMLPGWPQQ